jgi:MerR family transcriptional regulator, repressor of the yfmOP operon
MGDTLYTVDDVVQRVGVTPRTLHYYEQMGLIRPIRRTEGGHRLYDDSLLDRLQYILHLKEHLGLPLQEIRSLLEAESTLEQLGASYRANTSEAQRASILDEFITVLQAQIARIDDKIQQLQSLHTHFSDRLDRAEGARAKTKRSL